MVTNHLMYFDDYHIENIPRDDNKYVDIMANATSLAPINTEDEETILTIKNLVISSHAYVVPNFTEDHYFSTTYIDES